MTENHRDPEIPVPTVRFRKLQPDMLTTLSSQFEVRL